MLQMFLYHANLSSDLLQLVCLLKQNGQILRHKLEQITIDLFTVLQRIINYCIHVHTKQVVSTANSV